MPENPLITQLRDKRDALQKEIDDLTGKLVSENRSFTEDENKTFGEKVGEIRQHDDRITELVELDKRKADANDARAVVGDTGDQRFKVKDAPIYHRENGVQRSYFRDLYYAQRTGDTQAMDRLRRNTLMQIDDYRSRSDEQRKVLRGYIPGWWNSAEARSLAAESPESRALSPSAGAGGEFAPPLWEIEDFVAYARPGRKGVDSVGAKTLMGGVSSINLPKISGGTTTAIQNPVNTALSQTDMTTTSVSSGISTIGGKQVVALQLLEQSGIPFDEVVLQDLAEDYAKQFDTQFWSGSAASGQLNGVYTYYNASGTVNVTFTSGSPAVASSTVANSFYSKIMGALSNIATSRFKDPDTIWMHPRRWAWILASVDSSNRPLVVPNTSTAFNPIALEGTVVTEGYAGQLGQFQVITDPNIATNLGAGTNQDPVFVGVKSDLRVWESPLRMETFDQPYADSAGVLFRALAFSAAIPSRYTTSVSVINGTGLVAPTF